MSHDGLVAEGLVKTFDDVHALNGFDLAAGAGEIVGLVGANGSGKTTFAEVATGLIRPDAGRVRICGHDVHRDPRAARRYLGFASQDIAMYFSATVRENLNLFGGLRGLRRAALRAEIDRVVGQMQLGEVIDRHLGLLSGGQRRRAHVAAAILGEPQVLLLDEPTAGADPPTRLALLSAVRERAAAGAAVIYTTHYLSELVDLDATLAVIRAGRVISRGDQATLLAGLPGELRVRLAGPVPDRLLPLGTVEDGELVITSVDPAESLAGLLAAGVTPVSVDIRHANLDDLYHSLEAVPAHVR